VKVEADEAAIRPHDRSVVGIIVVIWTLPYSSLAREVKVFEISTVVAPRRLWKSLRQTCAAMIARGIFRKWACPLLRMTLP
jgi:hypothetical protein